MTFFDKIHQIHNEDFSSLLDEVNTSQVENAINNPELNYRDFLALLSPHAIPLLEDVAQSAHRLTVRHFGWTIQLYTPLYLANYCVNYCVYCGFNAANDIARRRLSASEVELEAQVIAESGLQHILILTGESRQQSSVSYIKDCVSVLKKYFPSIAIEIYPLSRAEYAELIAAGVDGLTIYQEVYDEAAYKRLHPRGPKRDYRFRLEAPERAGQAGIRTINIGALLGLNHWRREIFLCGMHAAYLQKRFPDIEISVSLPRIRPQYGNYQPEFPVSDQDLVQSILALRLFLPRVGITISTRENSQLRNNLIHLGITKMSAGSSTAIGGHTDDRGSIGQFEISDKRTVAEMRTAIFNLGYKPVLKDWHNLNMGGKTYEPTTTLSR